MTQNQVQQAIDLLEKLAELEAQLDLLNIDKANAISGVIPPEVKQAIADIEVEYLPKFEDAQGSVNAFRSSIQAIVLELGVTVKSTHRMAVFAEGRTTWKGKELTGFFKTMPELAEKFSHKSDPSVTIRKV